jgi:hypothetical protein
MDEQNTAWFHTQIEELLSQLLSGNGLVWHLTPRQKSQRQPGVTCGALVRVRFPFLEFLHLVGVHVEVGSAIGAGGEVCLEAQVLQELVRVR